MTFQKPKGTKDLYGKELVLFNNIITKLTKVALKYNLQEIMTPLFETTQLFLRAIGNETDIVEKEIYQFYDKSNRDLALRPEGTAGVIRAVIENKLYTNQKQAVKYFYHGPMYRYERPQKGRNREFHQFGVEILGVKSFLLDVEVILLVLDMIQILEINNTILNLNFFGSQATKLNFQMQLTKTLTNNQDILCDDCQKRVVNNPLRVLDCKNCQLSQLQLPKLSDYYSDEEKQYFNNIISTLQKLKVPYIINENLVRGLDYYNGLIFEVTISDEKLGKSQNTIVGGGRYDGLANQLGLNQEYPAIGFAFGIERLMLLLEDNINFNKQTSLQLYAICQENVNASNVLLLLEQLRNNDVLSDGSFYLFNEKQKNNLIKNASDNINNILVFHSDNEATLYQLKINQKQGLKFSNHQDLGQQLLQYIK